MLLPHEVVTYGLIRATALDGWFLSPERGIENPVGKEKSRLVFGKLTEARNTVSPFYKQNQKLQEAVKTFFFFLYGRILLRKQEELSERGLRGELEEPLSFVVSKGDQNSFSQVANIYCVTPRCQIWLEVLGSH